ncbi:MAG: hypothetical protein EBT98_09460 [Opitutaceae bacterium]|nr:hypothetical protein [Opitutaceae bacterium]NBR58757.1 hypothetical protein [Opitutaceae bacterium]
MKNSIKIPHNAPRIAPWHAGLGSARATLGPATVILVMAVSVVGVYYHSDSARELLVRVLPFRVWCGFLFSPLVTMLFSGVIPFLYLRLNPATARAHPWPHLLFFILFWAYKGFEMDLFYRGAAAVFGSGHDWLTIVKKVLFENFVYNMVFTMPYGVLLYEWKNAGFQWSKPLADLRAGRWYYRRILPVLLSVWAVWIPAAACVYSLPFPLQIVLFNLLNCFWVIFFSHVTARMVGEVSEHPGGLR